MHQTYKNTMTNIFKKPLDSQGNGFFNVILSFLEHSPIFEFFFRP